MLFEFIVTQRDEIVRRCRAKVASRSMPPPTEEEIDYGVPVFLDQLLDALNGRASGSTEINKTARRHGLELLLQGFTVSQVVHDYGDICQAITELAVEKDASIPADEFRMLNQCLDDAIASAVTDDGRVRNQSTVDRENKPDAERLGFFAHELRNLTNTSMLAFEVLRTGNVGVGGSTGTVLRRSLMRTSALIERSLAEVRLTEGIRNQEPFLVAGFIEELAPAAILEAEAKQITLTVAPVAHGTMISADRQVLGAVIGNLLQNAFKFTRPRSTVTLRVGGGDGRVLIEVQDECGGLPGGNAEDLFKPFEQRGAGRTGLGLGLAFSRWGVEANHGRIYARNLPQTGCVFTIDLPHCRYSGAPAPRLFPPTH
jgi:signal transduction histidine kinase